MLSRPQFLQSTALGVLYWFVAAMGIRLCGDLLTGSGLVIAYVLAIPLGWAAALSLKYLPGLRGVQVVTGVSIATAAATLCDGVALAWFPQLYGMYATAGAPLILWGAGWGLFASYRVALGEPPTQVSRR